MKNIKLPEGWKYVKISDLTDVITGGTPSTTKSEYWENGNIPWLPSGECQDSEIKSASKFITEEGLKNSSAKLMPINTIVIALTGATTGKVGILNIQASANQSVTGILPDDKFIPKYMFYYLRSIRKKVLHDSYGGAQKHISQGYVRDLEILLPPLDSQKKIVKVLYKAEKALEKRKESINLLNELVKSRFIEMFGSPMDNKFKGKTLPEIITEDKYALKRGPFGGSLKKDDFVQKGYLVYEQRHAIHNDFDYAKYFISKEKYEEMIMFKVEPKDLLVSCSGVTLGRISEVPEGAKAGIINQALLKITLNQNIMNNVYFINLFRNEQIQDKLFGFSRGSGIPNFPSMNEVKSMMFLCPPIELQNQFSDFVKQVDKLKFEMKKSLKELENNFNSLMQRAFKGELFN